MKAELVLGNLKREREALNGKLERLETALSKEWQDTDQEYLCTQQYNAMCLYAHILDERITDIEIKLEEKKLMAKEGSHETCHKDEDVFKKEIDPESYRKYVKDEVSDEDEDDDCCIDCSIRHLLKDIFGIEIL